MATYQYMLVVKGLVFRGFLFVLLVFLVLLSSRVSLFTPLTPRHLCDDLDEKMMRELKEECASFEDVHARMVSRSNMKVQ